MDFSTIALAASATVAATVATAACCMRDAKYNALPDAEPSHTAPEQSHPDAEPSQIATPPRQIDTFLDQARAGQDYRVVYPNLVNEKGERFVAMAVFDGHSNNQCIDELRLMDLSQFFVLPNPCEALYEACRGFNGGATINLFLIFEDRIENWNIGDSQGKVFMMVDGTWVIQATSVMHSPDNQAELARHGDRVECHGSSPDLTNIIGPKQISSNVAGVYVTFLDSPLRFEPVRLALTQALGHKGLTGCCPGFFSVPIVPGKRYRAICGTDGPWDVLGDFDHPALCTLSAQGIIDLVRERYAQEWNVTFGGVYAGQPDQKFTMARRQWDDCAVCICDI